MKKNTFDLKSVGRIYTKIIFYLSGCLSNTDCDWGMFCEVSKSYTCQYKQCPARIQHGSISFTKQPFFEDSPSTTLGQTARISCNPGYYVEHPDEFVALAREGFKIDGTVVKIYKYVLVCTYSAK